MPGAAYLFTKPSGGWSGTTSASAATATFTGGASQDQFGGFVALSPDGTQALVGAQYNTTSGSNPGAAYLFPTAISAPTVIGISPSAAGGGSGSSSGSATGAASFSNIDPGRATAFSFNENIGANQPVALNSVQITFSQHLAAVSVTGTTVNQGISAPAGKTVVGYLQITLPGVNDNAVSQGVITFTVDGQYLSSHAMNPAQVVMMRDHDGQWTALPTTLIGQNGNTYTYQAVTPGFSDMPLL